MVAKYKVILEFLQEISFHFVLSQGSFVTNKTYISEFYL